VEQGREIKQPKSFLFRIAKHIALTQLTQKSRQITSYLADIDMEGFEGSDVIEVVGSTEDEVVGREALGVHCEAVATLPPQCRQVYLLRKVHGLSHKEIAAHLGIAVSTVEKHLIKGVEICDRYVQQRTGAALNNDTAHETLRTPARRRNRRA
jgi:RNA polymerase sigma-70 factor (ECF subfamily)